jgi:hypothetical protein
MKKILKYSTILGVAGMLTAFSIPTASADTGGYTRFKVMDSHWNSLGFGNCGAFGAGPTKKRDCKFASSTKDQDHQNMDFSNKLTWYDGDTLEGVGVVSGADFGFFRLEMEATYQDSGATSWREHDATSGTVHQVRLFANVVAEPFDLLEILGEFGGYEPLVKYNPAHYGISPYAMVGYGVMGGLLEDLGYTRDCVLGGGANNTKTVNGCKEEGAYSGGATPAINTGAGVNIGLDQLAKGIASATGSTLPGYFKLPIEFSIGYHWQISNDELLWESMDEDLNINDGGLTYSVGLKW